MCPQELSGRDGLWLCLWALRCCTLGVFGWGVSHLCCYIFRRCPCCPALGAVLSGVVYDSADVPSGDIPCCGALGSCSGWVVYSLFDVLSDVLCCHALWSSSRWCASTEQRRGHLKCFPCCQSTWQELGSAFHGHRQLTSADVLSGEFSCCHALLCCSRWGGSQFCGCALRGCPVWWPQELFLVAWFTAASQSRAEAV